MTRDDIIRMAQEAGWTEYSLLHAVELQRLETFAALVAAEKGKEIERLREENRLWHSRAVALFWKCDTDNITIARLQSAAKEIDAALRQEEPK